MQAVCPDIDIDGNVVKSIKFANFFIPYLCEKVAPSDN